MTDLNDKIATLINSYTANTVSLAMSTASDDIAFYKMLVDYYDNQLALLGIHL